MIALYQGNDFIDVCKTFFDKHHEKCIKELLSLSIAETPSAATSTFTGWYLSVTEPDDTELKHGMCEVHK